MLSEAGHEVVRLVDCLPADSTDAAVLQKAFELDALLVSLNGDFADITSYPPADQSRVASPKPSGND
jgi:hypothetical protein